jgi:hypothetical protein
MRSWVRMQKWEEKGMHLVMVLGSASVLDEQGLFWL